MVFVWTDGFDSYAATSDLADRYQSIGANWTFNATGGRQGGGCLECNGATTISTPAGLGSGNSANMRYAFWLKISAAPAASFSLIGVRNSTNVSGQVLKVAADGTL